VTLIVVTVRKLAVEEAGLSEIAAEVLLVDVERLVTEIVDIEGASFPASS
jgi:hypothetical protein